MKRCFILPGLLQHLVPRGTWRKRFGDLAKLLCLFGQARREGLIVLETASLQRGAAPFRERKAGALPALSSQTKAMDQAVMAVNVSRTEQFASQKGVRTAEFKPGHRG
jgi:hypothetical protein